VLFGPFRIEVFITHLRN